MIGGKDAAATAFVIMPAAEVSAMVKCAMREENAANQGAPLLVDKQILAQKLMCSPAHIDNLRKRGLPVVYVGESVRFDPQDVLEWLKTHHND